MSRTERNTSDEKTLGYRNRRINHRQQRELANIFQVPFSHISTFLGRIDSIDVVGHIFPVRHVEISAMAEDITEGIIDEKTANQKKLMDSGRFDRFKGKTERDFLEVFSGDPLFTQVYMQARKEALTAPNERVFGENFRGALFEKMSYAHLSSLDNGSIPLMGDEVLDILMAMEKPVLLHDYGFGHVGIDGRYVPDGFFIKEVRGRNRVAGIIECSLGDWNIKERRKAQTYGSVQIAKRLGSLAANPDLIVVSPIRDIPRPLKINKDVINIELQTIPVSQAIFMEEFMPFAYRDFRGPDGETIASLRQQWRESTVGQNASFGEPGLFQAKQPA